MMNRLKKILTLSVAITASLFVNGQKIAYGQVVIVGQNFGVRITSILGEEELAKTLA